MSSLKKTLGLWACVALLISGCGRSGDVSKPETQWTDPKTLTPGPIQHDALTDDQMVRVKKLKTVFQDVDSSPMDKWVDDFRRDARPEDEIKIWENMADAYEGFTASRSLSLEAKKDVYQVVLLRSGAPEADVLTHLKLNVLTEADAKEIMKLCKAAPQPVEVVK